MGTQHSQPPALAQSPRRARPIKKHRKSDACTKASKKNLIRSTTWKPFPASLAVRLSPLDFSRKNCRHPMPIRHTTYRSTHERRLFPPSRSRRQHLVAHSVKPCSANTCPVSSRPFPRQSHAKATRAEANLAARHAPDTTTPAQGGRRSRYAGDWHHQARG